MANQIGLSCQTQMSTSRDCRNHSDYRQKKS